MCCLCYSLLLPFSCECFSSLSLPLCFLPCLNKCITVWNSYMLCSICCFRYSPKFSSKFNIEFIFQWSMLMAYSCSSFPPENYNLTVAKWIPFLYVKIGCLSSIYFCHTSWPHRPMVLCSISTTLTNNSYFHLYICGIVNIWWEIPLGRVEGQFSLRKWFCCYLGTSLHNLWFFSSANKMAPLPWTNWISSLGKRQ